MLSSRHEMVLSLKENTQQPEHMAAEHRLGADVGVFFFFKRCGGTHGDERKVQELFL